MATSSQQWQQAGNGNRPDPVITYDHMVNSEHYLYTARNRRWQAIQEPIL